MIFPTRPIRENKFSLGYNYYDDENVVQEDGRIAHFAISKETEKDGWQFQYYVDKYGFTIWDEKFSESKEGKRYRNLLLNSIINYDKSNVFSELGRDFVFGEKENLFRFSYGGPLSMRRGWFILNLRNSIVRSKTTIIS
jgi:hypothetical protein